MDESFYDLTKIDALTKAGVVAMINEFNGLFARAKTDEQFATIASAVSEAGREMVQRREQVEQRDPYRFGAILVWMSEDVAVKSINDDGEIVEGKLPRFLVFQARGLWADLTFAQWGCMLTEKAQSTWETWATACRRYFVSEEGKRVLKRAGVTPERFTALVPMDKALRGLGAIGKMDDHHVEALVDSSVSVREFRHVLRTTPEQHAQEQEERRQRDQQWIDHGKDEAWVEFDRPSGLVKVVGYSGGERWEEVLWRFNVVSSADAESIRDETIRWLLDNHGRKSHT